MYLAAAGVGHIGLVDYDTVDLSNLQQQIIHQTGDLGKPKIEFADLRRFDYEFPQNKNFTQKNLPNEACGLLGGVIDGERNCRKNLFSEQP